MANRIPPLPNANARRGLQNDLRRLSTRALESQTAAHEILPRDDSGEARQDERSAPRGPLSVIGLGTQKALCFALRDCRSLPAMGSDDDPLERDMEAMKRMRSSIAGAFVLAALCMMLQGCRRQQGAQSFDGPGGVLTWDETGGSASSLPGIDQATVYYESSVLVVWSDFDKGGGGRSGENSHGAEGHGRLESRDHGAVEFHYEIKGSQAGMLTVNETDYNLAAGRLFLVSAADEQVAVKQLQRDLRDLRFDRKSLQAFARGDSEIAAFFGGRASEQ